MEEIGDGLFRGEGVLVSEVFSNRSGLSPGDRYRAQIGESRLQRDIHPFYGSAATPLQG